MPVSADTTKSPECASRKSKTSTSASNSSASVESTWPTSELRVLFLIAESGGRWCVCACPICVNKKRAPSNWSALFLLYCRYCGWKPQVDLGNDLDSYSEIHYRRHQVRLSPLLMPSLRRLVNAHPTNAFINMHPLSTLKRGGSECQGRFAALVPAQNSTLPGGECPRLYVQLGWWVGIVSTIFVEH